VQALFTFTIVIILGKFEGKRKRKRRKKRRKREERGVSWAFNPLKTESL